MDQFDLTEFAQMFDAALASDNPAVKKALRNFMMVSALVHAQEEVENEERLIGPLETLVKKVNDLDIIVNDMQRNRRVTDDYRKYQDYYYSSNPRWSYDPNTSISSRTTTGAKSWSYDPKDDLNDTMIQQLLKDLKFNE